MHVSYDNRIVRDFAIATVVWGVAGMLAGLYAAIQLFAPAASMNIAELTFGRIRPVHTNAMILAFVGNGMFTGIYYSLQRLCKTRMFSDTLSRAHFWGWQLIVVAGTLTLASGITTGKKYAELEWPLDSAIAVVWILFTINLIGTILRRRQQRLYISIWFYFATAMVFGLFHVVNSLAIPVSFIKSYPVYAGLQDALMQWWYGQNAITFLLAAPYLGLMYYFVPKAANQPVYSYRLAIFHFWAFTILALWAGPRHLLYSPLPGWVQSLGTAFSILLIAPALGGVVNGMATLRGAWSNVRQDPVLKCFLIAIIAHGITAIEAPLLAIKSAHAFTQFTDYTIAHVHTGALGWNGFLTFGMLYWLIPRLYNTRLWSTKAANVHVLAGLIGTLLYVMPIYVAGISQGLMMKQFTADGLLPAFDFSGMLAQVLPLWKLRALGGTFYLAGVIIMIINLVKTARQGALEANTAAPDVAHIESSANRTADTDHRRPLIVTGFAVAIVAIIGVLEMAPQWMVRRAVPATGNTAPYTPLELVGRDIYIREGCISCHSQMVRPLRIDTVRYGAYSTAEEFRYDHPVLWGSKRTGPDLTRSEQENPGSFYTHHIAGRGEAGAVAPTTPQYPWLLTRQIDATNMKKKIHVLRRLGVPYPAEMEHEYVVAMRWQAGDLAAKLEQSMIRVEADRELVAMIAYLQRLGGGSAAAEEPQP